MPETTNPNREYKDRLFKFTFGNPEHRDWTLSLYNAVNNTNYTDPSVIEYTSIQDTLYLEKRNDVSFLIAPMMNLYEQQSTFNPNMPLRLLDYAVTLFKKFIEMSKKNIFGRTLIHLPVPRLVVFYNGTTDMPEEMELKLSDAFPSDLRDLSDIEVRVRMININAGKNRKLLEACKPLHEYSWIVDTIRNNKSRFKKMNDDKEILEMAIDKTLDTMPDSFLMKPFLEAHRAEVKGMLYDEYSTEKINSLFKQEGEDRLALLIGQLLSANRLEDAKKATTDKDYRNKLYNEFQIA